MKPGNLPQGKVLNPAGNREMKLISKRGFHRAFITVKKTLCKKKGDTIMAKHLFTSESVTQGHPDKLCDQISDGVLDAIISEDRNARVACETLSTTGQIIITGEITTTANVDIAEVARKVICEAGYNSSDMSFNGEDCGILVAVHKQSPDIAMGVDKSFEMKAGEQESANTNGAGDQGMMFGFACDETPELMPLPISLAHKMAKKLAEVRENGTLPYLRPDGKTQVTVEYDDNNNPVRVDTVVVSTQHMDTVSLEQIRKDMCEYVINPIIPQELLDMKTKVYVNPTGRFVTGGPAGDTGLTGRKIIVDTYGGYSRHGGGAFSGKDPTKVDRSAAYAARYVAKNVVAAGLAKKCEVQLAYAIGVAKPVSVMVDTFGTGVIADDVLAQIVTETFDLRPNAIIEALDLRKPIYKSLAAYGHMGREDLGVRWEQTDKAEALKKAAGI